ncbi:glycoside hydrolase family 5 protein [Collybia nuda]|uniref:mannan endo-1,4-beta-mannosidase n=1 Tax=Collybia nuda TaxID=64659 RepID=A0A9P6CLA1_9AGAR|nr:glycoside hydrolase family 5 protein [Collybia nuda]
MCGILIWQLILSALALTAEAVNLRPTPASKRNNGPPPPQFVQTQGGSFFVNGSQFQFVGTNAYWLHALNSDQDIDNTLASIAAANITVVRTWGFNDVETIPENGTWFQHISNGTITINNGTNGLQRLDKVMELAQKHGIYILLSLTNNWNPHPLDDPGTAGGTRLVTNDTRPRNTLSNDYGGMDLYVRQLGSSQHHDQFYTNDTIITAFKDYTTAIVSRYKDNPFVIGWELANDPRCGSSLPASPSCETRVVTRWHSDVAQHVNSQDPNHLVASGNQGFVCPDCPKLFQRPPPPPPVAPAPPQPSPAPGTRRRRTPGPLTRAKLLRERKAMWRKARKVQKRSGKPSGGVRIRGRWMASPAIRAEDIDVGSATDGSHGVDSEDILSISQVGFGSFQLFPDQNDYRLNPEDTTLPLFNQTLQIGLDWIRFQGETAALLGKPITLTGFGLVTSGNADAFVPFNSTAPFGSDQGTPPSQQPFGVTDAERDEAYRQWLQAGLAAGLQGMIQYQWGQGNLTAQEGTAVSPTPDESGVTPNQDETGLSPNDGYTSLGTGQGEFLDTMKAGAQEFGPDV